jgi:outer membrane protein
MNRYLITLLTLWCCGAHAQVRLTLQDAIAKTLQHNYDIHIATISTGQAARNNTLGNAGFSPNVFLNATATQSRSNVQSDLANGNKQNNPHAQSTNYNPALLVNWTIFDGGKMFLVKKQLDKLQDLSREQLNAQVQTTVSRVIQMYAQVVWQQKQLVAADTALQLAKVRMDITNLKYQTGAGAKIEYLQARVDYNARQADSLNFVSNLYSAFDSLSELMGENSSMQYLLDDSLELNTNLQPIDMDRLRDMNLSISVYRYNAQLSQLNARIADTYFWPTLSFNGGYNYNRTNSSTGFATFNQSYGPSGAFSLNLPLFEGGNLRRQSKVACLQAEKDELLYERQNTIVGRQFRTAWRNYEVSVAAYRLEHENIRDAKENLFVQQARFRVGVATTLEARQAENDYVTALERLYTAAYNLKVNETVVLELENELVKTQ